MPPGGLGGRRRPPGAGRIGLQRPRSSSTVVGRVVTLLIAAGVWELSTRLQPSLHDSVPTFSATCAALGHALADPSLWVAIAETMRSTVIGLGLCVAVGGVAGMLIATHGFVVASTRFLIDFSRTVPPLALVPLFLLVFGPTSRMEVLLVLAVGVWPVLLQTLYGVRSVDPELLQTARSFRLQPWRRLLFVVGPATMPYVATGIRICATLSLLLAIGSELIAGVPGLGQEILLSQQAGDTPRMFAQILISGVLGAVLSWMIVTAEHRLLGWHYRPRTGTS